MIWAPVGLASVRADSRAARGARVGSLDYWFLGYGTGRGDVSQWVGRARRSCLSESIEMGRQVALVLYVVVMAAAIVGVDFLFFRNRFWERLAANIGIVLVFGAFYFRFLRHP